MNREIKFRVWDGIKMWYPIKHNCHITIWGSQGFIPWGLYSNVGGERLVTGDEKSILNNFGILMEYTGFLDKAAKEIYENDIARGSIGGNTFTGRIIFSKGAFMLNDRWIIHFDILEVMGNIYQNPELLLL